MQGIWEPTFEIDLRIPPPPLEPNLYPCTICDAQIEIMAGSARPIATLIGASGESNVRVITIAGIEVHRCPFPGVEPPVAAS